MSDPTTTAPAKDETTDPAAETYGPCLRYYRVILDLLVVNLLVTITFGVLGLLRHELAKLAPTATATPAPSTPEPSGPPESTSLPTPATPRARPAAAAASSTPSAAAPGAPEDSPAADPPPHHRAPDGYCPGHSHVRPRPGSLNSAARRHRLPVPLRAARGAPLSRSAGGPAKPCATRSTATTGQ
ncbi:hypothetical protein ABZ599_16520 [Streptomyces misionensis]|uniref:hypothetical protein n=1 Tax=Streptomyces misionensis TaxID=67331 RepID=UPI0034099064